MPDSPETLRARLEKAITAELARQEPIRGYKFEEYPDQRFVWYEGTINMDEMLDAVIEAVGDNG